MNDKYRKIYEFYLNPPYSDLLWGGMQFDTLQEFTNYVRTIPYGKKSQLANQKRWKAKRDNICRCRRLGNKSHRNDNSNSNGLHVYVCTRAISILTLLLV